MNFVVAAIAPEADEAKVWKHVLCSKDGNAWEIGRRDKWPVATVVDVTMVGDELQWTRLAVLTMRELGKAPRAEVVTAWKAAGIQLDELKAVAGRVDVPINEAMADWQAGNLNASQTASLFQDLIDSGSVWEMSETYRSKAAQLIADGVCVQHTTAKAA